MTSKQSCAHSLRRRSGVSLALMITTVGALAAITTTAEAQISRANLEALAAPGAPGWDSSLPRSVDWSVSVFYPNVFWRNYTNYAKWIPGGFGGDPNHPSNLQYAEISGLQNQVVTITPYLNLSLPAPVQVNGEWRDGCGHAHFTYAFWKRVDVWSSGTWSSVFMLVASEGQVGRRKKFSNGQLVNVFPGESGYATSYCIMSGDPSASHPPEFTWKNNTTALTNFRFYRNSSGTINTPYAFVAMQGATHGVAGICPYFGCFPDVALQVVQFGR